MLTKWHGQDEERIQQVDKVYTSKVFIQKYLSSFSQLESFLMHCQLNTFYIH